MATLDFSMDNVKPSGEFIELGEGDYLVSIQGTEKKGTKDKFYEDGSPHEDNGKNYYLNISLRIHGGNADGIIETERLNLWNSNTTAVNIAKSTLKSIQNATGIHSSESADLHGKYMVMRIKKNSKGYLNKHYEAASIDAIKIAEKSDLSAPPPVQPQSTKPSWAV